MIEIHIRISRKFVLVVAAIIVVGIVVPFLLWSVGSSAGGMKVGPIQTHATP
jgi:hypothetical protein